MPKINVFEKYFKEYEDWFEKNRYIYLSELEAIKHFIPKSGEGIEIGVGTGRFTSPLGIKIGVEPSDAMRKIAEKRGIKVYKAVAENLPFNDKSFDFALLVTTICFVDDIVKTFQEAHRILKNNGIIIVGFVDKNSPIGKIYQAKKDKSKFYKPATFYSTEEVINLLKEARFKNLEIIQTIFGDPSKIQELQKYKEGYGEGSFVVIKAQK